MLISSTKLYLILIIVLNSTQIVPSSSKLWKAPAYFSKSLLPQKCKALESSAELLTLSAISGFKSAAWLSHHHHHHHRHYRHNHHHYHWQHHHICHLHHHFIHNQFHNWPLMMRICSLVRTSLPSRKPACCLWRAHNLNLTIHLPSCLIISHHAYHCHDEDGGRGDDNDDDDNQQHQHLHQHHHHLERVQPV